DQEDFADILCQRRQPARRACVDIRSRLTAVCGVDIHRRLLIDPIPRKTIHLFQREQCERQLHRRGRIEIIHGVHAVIKVSEPRAVALVPVDPRVDQLVTERIRMVEHVEQRGRGMRAQEIDQEAVCLHTVRCILTGGGEDRGKERDTKDETAKIHRHISQKYYFYFYENGFLPERGTRSTCPARGRPAL